MPNQNLTLASRRTISRLSIRPSARYATARVASTSVARRRYLPARVVWIRKWGISNGCADIARALLVVNEIVVLPGVPNRSNKVNRIVDFNNEADYRSPVLIKGRILSPSFLFFRSIRPIAVAFERFEIVTALHISQPIP